MKFKIHYIFVFFLLISCTQTMQDIDDYVEVKTYSSKGFALIYEDYFFESKIVDRKLFNNMNHVLHSFLKTGTLINISNPLNSESLTVKVKKSTKFPSIYSIVITRKMAEDLNLDINNPYVEIFEIKKNVKFIAKKGTIYKEEINVADKAPVTSIDINELTVTKREILNKKKKPSYIIDIAEFYYYESAVALKIKFEKEENMQDIKIKKISKNNFKVYTGPYETFNSMKTIIFSLNKLGFGNFNVININK